MDAGDWIALGGVAFALIVQSIGVAIFLTRVASQVQVNSKAIDALSGNVTTREQGRGLQAQIKRLEQADAGCKGEIGAVRTELHDRIERHGAKIAGVEQTVAAAVGRIEATMAGMQAAMERLIRAEEARGDAPQPQPPAHGLDFITQLQNAMTFQRMMKEMAN